MPKLMFVGIRANDDAGIRLVEHAAEAENCAK